MYNIRKAGRNTPPSDYVSVETVKNIVKEITNPIQENKPIAGDGLAFRSYHYNILQKKKV